MNHAQETSQQRALRQQVDALTAALQRYQSLFDNTAMGVAFLNRDGVMEVYNHRLKQLLGLPTVSDAPVDLKSFLRATDQEALGDFLQRTEAAARSSATISAELLVQVPQRGRRIFKLTGRWVAATAQVSACLSDITDERALERRMIQREKQSLLDTLVGGIAHELNNKLTPVMGFAELLRAQTSGPTAHYSDQILKGGQAAAQIIYQLQQLASHQSTETAPADLRAVVREALQFLSFSLRESRVTVEVSLGDEEAPVLIDFAQIRQVVINLVLNALSAMESSERKQLSLSVQRADNEALLKVRDTGHGIASENLDRIFDPFFTTRGPDRGTGLGLTLVQSFVRKHGGAITAASEPGQGAEFTATFPLHAPAAPEETAVDAPGLQAPTGLGRVLIVDDEEDIRLFIDELLRLRFACSIDHAPNGGAAQKLLEAHPDYDLVISDIRMPELNGLDLYSWLRERHPDLAGKFVFVTGQDDSTEDRERLQEWGLASIRKPFRMAALHEVCAQYLPPL